MRIVAKENFIPNLTKDIHYIAWTPYSALSASGYSQMAFADAIVRRNLPEQGNPELFYQDIDRFSKTGTFYPGANITLMPSYKGSYSKEQIRRFLDDAVKAQNDYIHAGRIVIDLRNYPYDKVSISDYFNIIKECFGDQEGSVYVVITDSLAAQHDQFSFCENATKDEVCSLQ